MPIPRPQHRRNSRPNIVPRMEPTVPKEIEFLLEVPNLGLADGYGQSARSMVKLFIDVCNEEGIDIKILNSRNRCTPISREEEFNEILEHTVDPKHVTKAKLYIRYSLPIYKNERIKSDIAVAYTMFETDRVPEPWVAPLNTMNAIVTPTKWGKKIFSKYLTPPVYDIPLPVNKIYYDIIPQEELLLMSEDKFRFITVGNYFQPDRKRLIPLIRAFGERFNGKNCELYVKSSWTDKGSPKTIPIDVECDKYPNVILDTNNIPTEDLIKRYCSSHAALFPSYGEGYGLPQVEISLLGRPMVVSGNTALSSTTKHMLDCHSLKCASVNSDYSVQCITGDTGHWFECDINAFLDEAEKLYVSWEDDKSGYRERIISNHINTPLREYAGHGTIKEQYRSLLLELLRGK